MEDRHLTRIEVKDDRGRLLDLRPAVKERVQLQARRIRTPDQRGYILDQNVANVRSPRAAWNRIPLDPLGRKSRGVLLIVEITASQAGL